MGLSTLQMIVLVTAGAGLASVLAAASLSLTLLAKIVNNMVSLCGYFVGHSLFAFSA